MCIGHQNIHKSLYPPHQEQPIITYTPVGPHGLDVPGNGRCHCSPLRLLHPAPSAMDPIAPAAREVPPFENSLQCGLRSIRIYYRHRPLPDAISRCNAVERADKDREKDTNMYLEESRLVGHHLQRAAERLPVWTDV